MMCNWKTTLIGPAFWMAGLPLFAEPAEIRVRPTVYAEVPRSTLQEAKGVASFLLEQASVRLLFAECRTREDEPPKDALCQLPVTPRDLQLRIVGKEMAKRARKGSECLGYAVVSGEFSSIANAYYHRAEELAANNMAARGTILGAILAHEIGHLLGGASHAHQGLMRAQWDDHDLRTLAQRKLTFMMEEAQRIAVGAAKRTTGLSVVASATPEVHLNVWNGHSIPGGTLAHSQTVVTKIFSGIGIRMNWKPSSGTAACSPGPLTIRIDFVAAAPASASPNAFAQSFPYAEDQLRIVVFLNRFERVFRSHPLVAGTRLAHVLAHEISHILQGVSRHSATGMMRTYWNDEDYKEMLKHPLPFEDSDVKLIHLGMASRQARYCDGLR